MTSSEQIARPHCAPDWTPPTCRAPALAHRVRTVVAKVPGATSPQSSEGKKNERDPVYVAAPVRRAPAEGGCRFRLFPAKMSLSPATNMLPGRAALQVPAANRCPEHHALGAPHLPSRVVVSTARGHDA